MVHRIKSGLRLLCVGVALSCLILLGVSAVAAVQQEITVTGNAVFGADPDRMYKEALIDAFQKAYLQVHAADLSVAANFPSTPEDPVKLQQELGICDYQVLRRWREGANFFVELKVTFGDSKAAIPRTGDLSRHARLKWTYQTTENINAAIKAKTALALNTVQTIEVLDPETGKRIRQYKTGLKSHDVNGDRYLVVEGDYVKVASLTKFNLFHLVFTWRKKFPNLSRYYLTGDACYLVDKSGLIHALDWEDGSLQWKLAANSQAEISEIGVERLLIALPDSELWLVDHHGVKLWTVRLDGKLLARPVAGGAEIYCPLANGDLKVLDRDSGRTISTWKVKYEGDPRNLSLGLGEKELFLAYNTQNNHGYLQVFHRLTGESLWKVGWDQAVTGPPLSIADLLVIGVGNRFEGREPVFGMKLWEEPAYGRITRMYLQEGGLLVIAGDRVYSYDVR